jgi:hypothetical protein
VSHRELKLTNGMVALVDAEDYERVAGYNWGVGPICGYVRRSERKNGKVLTHSLHRTIMGLLPGQGHGRQVDHINRDKLDNRKANLRICTPKQNAGNRGLLRKSNKSGYRGVHYVARSKKYLATIGNKRLGLFATAEEAARVRDRAAIEAYGREFATLNFPEENVV